MYTQIFDFIFWRFLFCHHSFFLQLAQCRSTKPRFFPQISWENPGIGPHRSALTFAVLITPIGSCMRRIDVLRNILHQFARRSFGYFFVKCCFDSTFVWRGILKYSFFIGIIFLTVWTGFVLTNEHNTIYWSDTETNIYEWNNEGRSANAQCMFRILLFLLFFKQKAVNWYIPFFDPQGLFSPSATNEV